MNVLERAEWAKACLENPAYREATSALKDEIVRALEAAQLGDVDAHHQAAVSLALLAKVKARLERFVQDGHVEAKRLEQQNWIDRARQRLKPRGLSR